MSKQFTSGKSAMWLWLYSLGVSIAPLLKDGYKIGHPFDYPKRTIRIYSNMTARKGRIEGWTEGTVFFGGQAFVKKYLIEYWKKNFFDLDKDMVLAAYKRFVKGYLGIADFDTSHLGALHDLGYLPICVKMVPEGTLVPYRVPMITITNTLKEFFWVTNMLETLMSLILWKPITSATTSLRYRRAFKKYAALTGGDPAFVQWQSHDFSMRGMDSIEGVEFSGAAHLLFSSGTDTLPAIGFIERFYFGDIENELIGMSVCATEHSISEMGTKEGELQNMWRLLTEVHPTGILSYVSDTWDLWKVITEYLPRLKAVILQREGKLVIRPDSGDPVKILCGDADAPLGSPARKGVVELLWETFGGKVNAKGYKELDPHIGTIYGDSITPERQLDILEKLAKKGFASTNVVLGIGSFTYTYVTRDTHGMAVKATYGEVMDEKFENIIPMAIFKDPITDSGMKKSAKGLLAVDDALKLHEEVSWAEEANGVLRPTFYNGEAFNVEVWGTIVSRAQANI